MLILPSITSATSHGSAQRSGFSLIEVVIAVSIMSVMAGVAIPVTRTVLDRSYAKATKVEMQNLSDAAARMFEDTWTLPTSVEDLLMDSEIPGWSGPYLPGSFADGISGLGGYEVDGWSNNYTLSRVGDTLAITSEGPDGSLGSDDDLAIALNVTSIRRETTLELLTTINIAIRNYNSVNQVSDPLPANYGSVRSALVSFGYLPDSALYQTDAWGDSFIEDPEGSTPVVRVVSPNISHGSSTIPSDELDSGSDSDSDSGGGSDWDWGWDWGWGWWS